MATTNEEKKYIQSDAVTQAQQAVQNQQAQKPGQYQSQYQQPMTDLLGQIQNRDKFQYDINADALYQQAAQRYIQQGKQAMMDTMGQAAALTGGYGNSYAQNAGQQAYQGYLQSLIDQIPKFQQMALQQYQMEGDDLISRYNLLANQEESAYGRYMDSLNQYYSDLDRLQNNYESERSFDYGKYMDQANYDMQYNQQAWENAWKLYQMDIKTPEVLAILGIPEEPASGGGDNGGSSSGSGGRSGNGGGNVTDDGPIDIESEYLAMKQAGFSTRETDSYLKSAVAAGLISQREATDLREKRY